MVASKNIGLPLFRTDMYFYAVDVENLKLVSRDEIIA